MTVTNTFVIKVGDYGHELDFYVLDEDGAVYTIPAEATLTFEAYLDGTTDLVVEDTTHVAVVGATSEGHIRYTVQSAAFATAGTYWCQVLINTITTDKVQLTVLADQTTPA